MKVFKFGGASVKNADAIKNLSKIVANNTDNKVIVISALDKTTNHLECVFNHYLAGNNLMWSEFQSIKDFHFKIIDDLFEGNSDEAKALVSVIFNQLEEKLKVASSGHYEYEYDQIISFGELFSTRIVSSFLNYLGVKNVWVDIRTVLKTDDNYKSAELDEELSKLHVGVKFNFNGVNNYITQGFIASTSFGTTTTFGREGSDYTASILGSLLNAESVTIWKDVPGVLNADPKLFQNTIVLPKIPYREAVELAYSGAKLIHPKTIKPLHNSNIPLFVKSFVDPSLPGTIISHEDTFIDSPVIIVKENQVLLSILPKDISFVIDDRLIEIISILEKYKIKSNIIQSSAVNFTVCVDSSYRLEELINEFSSHYKVLYNDNLTLFTIRHYDEQTISRELRGKTILLEQRTRSTARFVLK